MNMHRTKTHEENDNMILLNDNEENQRESFFSLIFSLDEINFLFRLHGNSEIWKTLFIVKKRMIFGRKTL